MPLVARKAIYNIEDYISYVSGTNWTPAFNQCIAAIKADRASWNTSEGMSYTPAAIIQLGARQYSLATPLNNIDVPIQFVGVGYSLKSQMFQASGWNLGGSYFRIKSTNLNTRFTFVAGSEGSSFDKIGFIEEHVHPANTDTTWSPVNYDYLIKVRADDITIGDVFAICNKFVSIEVAQRLTIKNFTGHVFTLFWSGHVVLDLCTIQRAHLWPWWSKDWRVGQYTQSALVGFETKRVDGLHIDSFFMIFGYIGLIVRQAVGDPNPFKNGTLTGFVANKFYTDLTLIPVYVTPGCVFSHQVFGHLTSCGLKVLSSPTLGEYTTEGATVIPGSYGVVMQGNYYCHIEIASLRVEKVAYKAIYLEGGSANFLNVGSGHYLNWDLAIGYGHPYSHTDVANGNTLNISAVPWTLQV